MAKTGKSKPKPKADSPRRREVRKSIPKSRRSLRQILTRAEVLRGSVTAALFVALCGLIVFEARNSPVYQPGQVVDRAIVARVNFKAEDLDLTKAKRTEARTREPNIYVPNSAFFAEAGKALQSLPAAVAAVESVAKLAKDLQDRFALSDEALKLLKAYHENAAGMAGWVELTDEFISGLRTRAILDSTQYQLEVVDASKRIRLMVEPGKLQDVDKYNLINLGDAAQVRERIERLAQRFPEALTRSIVHYFVVSKKPTYLLDQQASEVAKQAAADAVPIQLIEYIAGTSVLVPLGKPLTEDGYALLEAEHDAYLASLGPLDRAMVYVGPLVLLTLLTLTLGGYVMSFMPRVAQNAMRGFALASLLLICLGLAWSGVRIGPLFQSGALVAPALLLCLVLAIAYDQRFAIGIGVLYCLITALALNLTVGMALLTIVATMVAAAQVGKLRHRSTLGRTGVVTGLTVALGVWVVGYTERQVFEGTALLLAKEALLAFVMCIMVGFFVLGILPLIERVFKVTTGMTLLEHCDMNHPLLRRLQQAAPGTYNHSCTMAILSEAAAEAINADGLLCRVGAYFHDIGKMNKPHYFVENQAGGPNRHEKLSPAMSLLIIVGHVKDGIEMAREYGLPRVLHHFIESHHGTTLVEYFYHAAKEQRGESEQPEEIEFRYPGPKPQSREAAIIMICDAVESAARAMPELTAGRVEQLVHKVAMKRLLDGQFDECDITLAELSLIEQAVTKSLISIHHSRIAYPTEEKDKDRKEKAAGRSGEARHEGERAVV